MKNINTETNHTIISVVICTYNRAKSLYNTLQSLLDQTLSKSKYEIIVVDNGSTDDTAEVVKSFQVKRKYPIINFLYEKKLGLGHARNSGFQYAHGKYIAFTDDDAVVDKEWLKNSLNLFDNVKPTPYAVGGPIIPVYYPPKPLWFKNEYDLYTRGKASKYLDIGDSFSGPNMIFQKKILQHFGGFHAEIGMKSDYISVGEETYLFEKIWDNVGKQKLFYYSPNLIVHHRISPCKMSISYQLGRWFVSGQSLQIRYSVKPLLKRFQHIFKILGYFLVSFFMAFLSITKYRYYQNWVVERVGPFMYIAGYLISYFGIKIRLKQRF